MTKPSTRFINWELPAQPDFREPDPAHFDFASWLKYQDTASFRESNRLQNLVDLVAHVGYRMGPSRLVAKRNTPYLKTISNAYKDKQIQTEFVRWADSLQWTEYRQTYARACDILCSPLATPWLVHVVDKNPLFKFGLQLTFALSIDDNQADQKTLENGLKKLTQAGCPMRKNDLENTSALDTLLQHNAKETPSQDIRPFVDVFSTFYDPTTKSRHSRNSPRGIPHYHDALFRGAIDAYKNTLAPLDFLALPNLDPFAP